MISMDFYFPGRMALGDVMIVAGFFCFRYLLGHTLYATCGEPAGGVIRYFFLPAGQEFVGLGFRYI